MSNAGHPRSDGHFVARILVFPEEKNVGRNAPVFVGAERTGAQDLDRIFHSIRSFPHSLCVWSAVDKGGDMSVLGEPRKSSNRCSTRVASTIIRYRKSRDRPDTGDQLNSDSEKGSSHLREYPDPSQFRTSEVAREVCIIRWSPASGSGSSKSNVAERKKYPIPASINFL